MATAQTPTPEDLKKRKEAAEAEKQTLDAELALAEVRKKLQAATAQADTVAAGRTEAQAAAKAEQDLADARKAKAEADLAALKATLGGVPTSGVTGSVTVGDKGGLLEMALLTATATETASRRIASAVKPLMEARPNATLHVLTQAQLPNFQAAGSFKAQKSVVLRALTQALAAAKDDGPESLAAAGIAIESITKLLGFFRSDFSVNGAEIAVDDLALLQATLSQRLGAASVVAPGLYNPAAVRDTGALVAAETAEFGKPRSDALAQARRLDTAVAAADAAAAVAGTPPDQVKARQAEATRQRALAERLRAAVTAYDTLLTRLLANDEAANAMLRDLALFNALQRSDAHLLLLKVHKAAGSFYTQKNLWNALGAMPFSVAGGVVVSFTLMKGQDGTVLDAGLIPLHGGFDKVGQVPDKVNTWR